MCGILGFGVAGLIGAVALAFGVGSIFNGMAAFGTSLALLGQTLMQPVVMLLAAALGFVGGAGFVLGAPAVVSFYYRLRHGHFEADALMGRRESRELPAASPARQLPGTQSVIVRPARRRRAAVRVRLDREL